LLSTFMPPSSSILAPEFAGLRDIPLLAGFRSTAEQYDQRIAVPTEIDSISGPEVEPCFHDPTAQTLQGRKVAVRKSRDRNRNSRRGVRIETAEPSPEGTAPIGINVFSNPDRDH
jgi:hypothetical protein